MLELRRLVPERLVVAYCKILPNFGEFDAEGCASDGEYFNPGGLRKKTILKDFREKRKILKNRNTRNGSFENR